MNWKDNIAAAARRTAPYVLRTPILTATPLDLGYPVEFKLENLQRTGSFKARGAFNTLLSQPVPEAGIVAASGGNHGAAVADAASTLRHIVRIYVPETAGPTKIALIQRLGADLVVVSGTYADALEAAQTYEADTGAMQIHAYDAPATVAGQGTLMAEWEDQGLEADTILIAVGGGGLIAGALAWLQGRRKVVGVEPHTARALHAAMENRSPTDVNVSGIAANALGARRIGSICFDLATEHNLEIVLVADAAIRKAQKVLWQEFRLLVEPAGAAALAALLSGAYEPAKDERVAVLLCGANIAPDPFEQTEHNPLS